MKLSLIRCDCGTQSRAAINEEAVSEYAERMVEGDKFPPVEVFFDGNKYYLADGFHRVLAANRNGFLDFECNVHPGTKTDALKFSLRANALHGLKRTNADKRHSVELALSEWPQWSDRALADACAVSFTLVADVRKTQVQESCTSESALRIGRDGKQYPVKQSSTGQSSAESGKQKPSQNGLHCAFAEPACAPTPEQIKEVLARESELKAEVEYHLKLVKADAEIVLERLDDCTIHPGDLLDTGIELRFAAKKVEALISQMEWPGIKQSIPLN
ncbi:MAG TPA: ParB N-terminal domain-containing protein [Verrucomicrobiae bacterium]|nr:ParB N-terminal domain-containing protein [Verrucomicrobiae bacterium]